MEYLLAILLGGVLVMSFFWYLKMIDYQNRSFEPEIKEMLLKEGKKLKTIRIPNWNDWKSGPFPIFQIKLSPIQINGISTDQTFYRIVEYEYRTRKEKAWVRVETSPFREPVFECKKVDS